MRDPLHSVAKFTVPVNATQRRRGPFRSWLFIAVPVLLVGILAATTGNGVVGADPAGTALPAATATPSATASASATPTAPASATPAPSATEPPAATVPVPTDLAEANTSAMALLATLSIKGKAPRTGYDRTGMFGTAWLDVDRNGCNTRDDILARDLTAIVTAGPCRVTSGTLLAPYTGQTVLFVRGQDTSRLVQIDHLVALSNAWQTGAQQLSQDQRVALANDPLNLLAADGFSNSQKSDGDAATWLPAERSFRCEYVALQISVKASYGLWVAPAEHDAMTRILSTCPDQRGFASTLAPDLALLPGANASPDGSAGTTGAGSGTGSAEVSYANCTAARAAGAAPVRSGDPGYSRSLDRDGDGVGCE